jgi:hypothetical protein
MVSAGTLPAVPTKQARVHCEGSRRRSAEVGWAVEHLALVLGVPDEVVVDQENRSCSVSVLLRHISSIAHLFCRRKRGAGRRPATPFYHPTKGGLQARDSSQVGPHRPGYDLGILWGFEAFSFATSTHSILGMRRMSKIRALRLQPKRPLHQDLDTLHPLAREESTRSKSLLLFLLLSLWREPGLNWRPPPVVHTFGEGLFLSARGQRIGLP